MSEQLLIPVAMPRQRHRVESRGRKPENPHSDSPPTAQGLIGGFWGVRYQVKDVQRAITFYTQTLGFNLEVQNLPAFGQVSIGGLKLILSGPGASGSRPMPDGRQQEPGGWNRIPSTEGISFRHSLPATLSSAGSSNAATSWNPHQTVH